MNDQKELQELITEISCIVLHLHIGWVIERAFLVNVALHNIWPGEMNYDQDQEQWMNEVNVLDKWVKSVIIYIDRDCMWNLMINMRFELRIESV